LYNEKIRDLLDVSKNDLKIRENKKTGNFVENLTDCYVSDKHELFRIINYGQKNRAVCSTNMNDSSSRSHLIFLLAVNQFNKTDNSSKNSKLYLIDLAGSEKISKTGAQGKALE
jgi:kinesin family protein 5